MSTVIYENTEHDGPLTVTCTVVKHSDELYCCTIKADTVVNVVVVSHMGTDLVATHQEAHDMINRAFNVNRPTEGS